MIRIKRNEPAKDQRFKIETNPDTNEWRIKLDKPKRRPGQTGVLVGVRLQPDMLAEIDWWADYEKVSRPEIIRKALRQLLGDERPNESEL